MNTPLRSTCAILVLITAVSGLHAQAGAATPEIPAAEAFQAVDESTLGLAEAPANGATGSSASILPYFLRMVLVLALVIASIYGLYALLKRSAKPASNPDAFLRVLATTNLAVGRSLHVVALGEKAWLVGSTDASIGLIAEVEDKELVDALALRAAAEPEAPRRDFTSLLGELLGRKGGKRSGSRNQPSPLPGDFFSRQKDRLKKF